MPQPKGGRAFYVYFLFIFCDGMRYRCMVDFIHMKIIVFLLISFFSSFSFSGTYAPFNYYQCNISPVNAVRYTTESEALASCYTASRNAQSSAYPTRSLAFSAYKLTSRNSTSSSYSATATFSDNNGVIGFTWTISLLTNGCRVGDTQTNINGVLTCSDTCPAGKFYNPATQTCGEDCSSLKGGQTPYFSTTANANDRCVQGCLVQMDSGSCGFNAQNQQGCYYIGSFTGAACSGSTSEQTSTEPPPTPETDCIKKGLSYGTVNGVVVCVAKTSPTAAKTVDITSTKTTTTTKDNANNTTNSTTTQKTTTFNPDGTVTTSTKNPDGSTTEKQQDKKTFCEENPNLSLCKQTNFSGGCGAFQCDGDAVQCAIAKKQHQDRCDDLKENSVSDLGSDLLAGQTPSQNPLDNANADTVNLPTSLTSTTLLPKSCLPDENFAIGGHVLTIPVSKLCDGLQAIGTIVKIFSYLIGAMIIFRRG